MTRSQPAFRNHGVRRRQFVTAVRRGLCIAAASALLGFTVGGAAAPEIAPAVGQSQRAPEVDFFPLGVFEDANVLRGDRAAFEAMARDLLSRGFDSIFFTNNALDRDRSLLDLADQLGIGLFVAPAWELDRTWWPSHVPATMEAASAAIRPIVDQLRAHRSVKGYSIADEPTLPMMQKLSLATRAFRVLDPDRPAMPTLVGVDRVGPLLQSAQPDVLLIDVYPFGRDNAIGDFRMTGFGYADLDLVSYVRLVARDKPTNTPLWMILQAHDYRTAGRFALRTPTAAEVRAENWLALGEGATGIFWFIYSSERSWTGLKDNQTLFHEVSLLARRVSGLRDVLLNTRRGADRFTSSPSARSYVRTLLSGDGSRSFALVVNRDCERSQKLTIDAPGFSGKLHDLETDQLYPIGATLSFAPGDGRIFELIGPGSGPERVSHTPIADPSPAPDPTPVRQCTG